MKNIKKLSLCSILIFALLLASCSSQKIAIEEKTAYVEPTYNKEHTPVDFNTLQYVRPNTEEIGAQIASGKN